MHYRQGCALANLRLEFLRMICLNLRRAVGTRISFTVKGRFFGPEFEVRSVVLRWSQRHFTSFWLWDHGNSAFSGARKSLGARDSCTQINRLIYWLRRFGCLLGSFGRFLGALGTRQPREALGGSWESLGRLSGGSWEVLGGETKQENSSETTKMLFHPSLFLPYILK